MTDTMVRHHTLSQDWDIHPVSGLIGAEIRNIDLNRPVSEAQADDLRWLLAQYSVIFFTGQHIGPKDHVALAGRLGRIKPPNTYLDPSAFVEGFPEVATFSTDNNYAYQTDVWHADVTSLAEPSRFSVVHMQVLPDFGGDTLWASNCEAYDRLSEPMKEMLEPMTVLHQHPRIAERNSVHPLVIAHPLTGRKALFVNNNYAKRIPELTPGESDALLGFFARHGTQPELICRWRWNVGDVAIWENHYVQHYAIYDYGSKPRKIHRIEVDPEAPRPANGGNGA